MPSAFLRPGPAAVGVALVVGGAFSLQLGAAIATALMPIVGLWMVALFRYAVMSLTHTGLSLPYAGKVAPHSLWWGVLLAVPLLGMNIAIYAAFARIGVGLAVTIELLGPILLAAIMARRLSGWGAAALAIVGMVCVSGPSWSTNPAGIGFAVLAAFLWAVYLLVSAKAGQRLPGLVPLAVASTTGLLILVPLNLAATNLHALTLEVMGFGIVAGLLSSAIPYAADIFALRRLPMHVASNLMSLHPVAACLTGALVLGERLSEVEVLGLLLICTSNIVVGMAERRARRVSAVPGAMEES